MYEKLLVPLDGSKVAEQILPYARLLAGKLAVPVELVGVIDVAALAAHVSAGKTRYLDTLVAEEVRSSGEYLKGVAGSFSAVSIKYTIERGKPEEVIIGKAAADKGTLIAMATHGRSGINRWLLGSVAEKVLRGATNPLLLVRAPEGAKTEGEGTLKSIIVPLDGSELAERVLPHVTALAKKMALKIVVVRAYRLRQIISSYYDYIPDWEALEAESKGVAISYLDSKVRQLKSEGLVEMCPIVSEGEAAENIIDLAKEIANSLVAMCTHGRSGVQRWVLGSVTEKVARHSGGPILIIRAA